MSFSDILLSKFRLPNPVCVCYSRNRSGSSWLSWRRPSVSSAWPRSVCTTPMTSEVCYYWPVLRATLPWSTSSVSRQRRPVRTTSHSSPSSSSESKCVFILLIGVYCKLNKYFACDWCVFVCHIASQWHLGNFKAASAQ